MSIKQGGNTIAGAVGKYPLNERNISNCITEIPQDIKLELNNGTLTLKAGSKVYVPNGAGVFDELTIANDLSGTPSVDTATALLFVSADGTSLQWCAVGSCGSGTTDAGTKGTTFYNTSSNQIISHNSGGNVQVSFPLCEFNSTSNTVMAINQVFNGFGYIGSTVFALPGVKGLIPNGRNADGTLKNIATEVISVQTYTYTGTPIGIPSGEIYAGIDTFGAIQLNVERIYNEIENFIYNGINPVSVCEFAKYRSPSGKIANFTLKTAYHALDWNDSSTISGWAMPSGRHIDLTFAHGQSYIAPADGYFLLVGYVPNSTLANVGGMHNQSTGLGVMTTPSNMSVSASRWCLPVKKGESVIMYLYAGTATLCRFIYAEGAQ